MSIFHSLLNGIKAPEDYIAPAGSYHDTDKFGHGYIPAYNQIAADLGQKANVCELGIHNGASLFLWRECYFPQGLLVGVDNRQVSVSMPRPAGDTRTALFDQTDPELYRWLESLTPSWDLIVDDCSHDGELTLKSWKLLWPLVRSGGYYVIEDWMVTGAVMRQTAHSFIEDICYLDTKISAATYFRGNDDGLIIIQKRLPR